jgi:hypothetical protein
VGSEQPACQAAIIQALRFHFNKRPKDIAALMDIRSQTVSMITNDSLTVLSWGDRRYKQEAIEAAKRILDEITRTL